MNRCFIRGTIFPHKNIHKLTWKSPDGKTVNQIDHIIINSKWRRSLLDVRAYRGADVNRDNFLIQAVIQLKLRKTPHKENIRKIINIQQLKLPAVRRLFNLELKNRFGALHNFDEDNISNQYELIKKTCLNTAKDTLGFQTKKNKEWMSEDTWKKIEERKEIKQKILNSRSTRIQEQLQSSYKGKGSRGMLGKMGVNL